MPHARVYTSGQQDVFGLRGLSREQKLNRLRWWGDSLTQEQQELEAESSEALSSVDNMEDATGEDRRIRAPWEAGFTRLPPMSPEQEVGIRRAVYGTPPVLPTLSPLSLEPQRVHPMETNTTVLFTGNNDDMEHIEMFGGVEIPQTQASVTPTVTFQVPSVQSTPGVSSTEKTTASTTSTVSWSGGRQRTLGGIMVTEASGSRVTPSIVPSRAVANTIPAASQALHGGSRSPFLDGPSFYVQPVTSASHRVQPVTSASHRVMVPQVPASTSVSYHPHDWRTSVLHPVSDLRPDGHGTVPTTAPMGCPSWDSYAHPYAQFPDEVAGHGRNVDEQWRTPTGQERTLAGHAGTFAGHGGNVDGQGRTPSGQERTLAGQGWTPASMQMESRPVSSYRPKKIADYDGKSAWTDYLVQFQIAAELNRWTDRQKAMELATSLVGSARGVLSDMKPEERLDFDALVKRLTMRFKPKDLTGVYQTQLRSYCRKRNQSVPELMQAINVLVRKAFPSADDETRSYMAVSSFVTALHDEAQELFVFQRDPKSIEEAGKAAMSYETFHASRQRESSGYVRAQSKQEFEGELSSLRTAMTSLSGQIANIWQRSGQPGRGNGPRNRATPNRTTGQGQGTNITQSSGQQSDNVRVRRGACFLCGEEGHWRNDCPRNQVGPGNAASAPEGNPGTQNQPPAAAETVQTAAGNGQ